MSKSYGGVGGDSQTGRKSSIALRAREIADRIDKLLDQVQEVFTCGKSRESRVRHVCSLADEIRCDMFPVVNFIERRRPPGTAKLFLNRIEYVLTEAEICASLDIPEWTSGVESTVPPRRNLARAAKLSVLITLNAASIRGWADDIESEEPASNTPTGRKAAAIDDDSHLSPAKLAEVFCIPPEALRLRLNRWRETNHEGWIENPDRKPREPKYLYRVGAVRHIIDELRATS